MGLGSSMCRICGSIVEDTFHVFEIVLLCMLSGRSLFSADLEQWINGNMNNNM